VSAMLSPFIFLCLEDIKMPTPAIQNYLRYIEDITFEDSQVVTYEMYCGALDLMFNDTLTEVYFNNHLNENILGSIRKMNLARGLAKVFNELKYNIQKIAKDFKMNLGQMIQSFKNREVYDMLKAFGFNFKLIFRAIGAFTNALRGGLLEVFREMARTKTFQKIRRGAIKVDEVLEKYPILKRLTGIVVAGLLLYIWLNMTFIGDLDYDFNFSDTIAALQGSFSIADIFTSPEGLMLVTLFGTGFAFGLSVPWLGKSLYNLTLAIVYTGYAKLKGDKKKIAQLKKKMRKGLFR
jgi:hypothetical protein